MTISFTGNVGGAPELKFSSAGKAWAQFTVAETHRKNVGGQWEDDGTTWRRVTVFGALAEAVTDQISKGTRVVVVGREKLRTYRKDDGSTGFSLDVVADVVGIVPRANQASQAGAQHQSQPARPDPFSGGGDAWNTNTQTPQDQGIPF